MNSQPIVKILAGLGSLIVLFTAYMHMQGLPEATEAVAGVSQGFMKKAIPAVWVMPSVHMVFIGFLAFGLSFYRSKACAVMLIAFGLWLCVDAVIVFSAVGPFIPVYMLGAAGLSYLVAGFMLRKSTRS